MTLDGLLDSLACWSENNPEDMCSVKINSDGRIYLGLGLHDSEAMTLDKLTEWCEDQI